MLSFFYLFFYFFCKCLIAFFHWYIEEEWMRWSSQRLRVIWMICYQSTISIKMLWQRMRRRMICWRANWNQIKDVSYWILIWVAKSTSSGWISSCLMKWFWVYWCAKFDDVACFMNPSWHFLLLYLLLILIFLEILASCWDWEQIFLFFVAQNMQFVVGWEFYWMLKIEAMISLV